MNNLSKEQIFEKVETLVKDKRLKTKEELHEYLTDLKNKGILTKAQIDDVYSSLLKLYNEEDNKNIQGKRMMMRTPQKKNFENNNSYGFSQVSFLVINLITLMLAVVMINLLGK